MAVTFNYVPHPAQQAIHQARSARFRTVCTGRRFGKTLCLAAELLDRGGSEEGGDYGWVAPTYNVAERGVEAFRTIAEGFVRVVGRMPTRVEFEGAAGPVRVWFLSADNADNIRGYGFEGLVIDEAASIPVDVWHFVLRPTIAQTLGWAVFVSTPKGRNWFYDLYTRGLDPAETEYASFTFPSKASPYFPEQEWEEAKRTLPEDVFRQEYMADFLEDSAGVFRGVDGCLIEDCRLKIENYVKSVVIGCDLAKHTDWTVLIAMDAESGRCFAMERFNQLEWPIQKERIVSFARKYRGRVILDATGIGDPIFDDLKPLLANIEGYRLTPGSKVALIQRLIVAVEQRRVSWPGRTEQKVTEETKGGGELPPASLEARKHGEEARNVAGIPPMDIGAIPATVVSGSSGASVTRCLSGESVGSTWDVLTNEMKRYEYAISPSGNLTYSAPAGYHDDCVMALALANHGRWETENCGRMLAVAGNGRGWQARMRRRERAVVG